MSHDWGFFHHEAVVKIATSLGTHGIRCWLDEQQIKGNIDQKMTEGIDSSQYFLVFITANYLKKVASGNIIYV